MSGTNLPTQVRNVVDEVLRKRIVHQRYFEPQRYTPLLDEITTQVMTVIGMGD